MAQPERQLNTSLDVGLEQQRKQQLALARAQSIENDYDYGYDDGDISEQIGFAQPAANDASYVSKGKQGSQQTKQTEQSRKRRLTRSRMKAMDRLGQKRWNAVNSVKNPKTKKNSSPAGHLSRSSITRPKFLRSKADQKKAKNALNKNRSNQQGRISSAINATPQLARIKSTGMFIFAYALAVTNIIFGILKTIAIFAIDTAGSTLAFVPVVGLLAKSASFAASFSLSMFFGILQFCIATYLFFFIYNRSGIGERKLLNASMAFLSFLPFFDLFPIVLIKLYYLEQKIKLKAKVVKATGYNYVKQARAAKEAIR